MPKTRKLHHSKYGLIKIHYGFNIFSKEYFTTALDPHLDDEYGIIFSVGTFTTLVPHPEFPDLREWDNFTMARLWHNLDVPEKDIQLLLKGFFV